MDGAGDTPELLPAAAHLRAEAAPMERTLSQDMREEQEDLKEAAEQTLNIIMDLSPEGKIKWVSASWEDVIGTDPKEVTGKPIEELILDENKGIFKDAVESMSKDDTKSQIIRFRVALGPASKLLPIPVDETEQENAPQDLDSRLEKSYGTIDLEGQGIMVYDRRSGGESHTMWMIRPFVPPRQIKIDLPPIIVEGLGSGAEILASHLTMLAEAGLDDPAHHAPPPPVLCRICERQIPPWWFEKHTELCLQEHQAEMEVQICQDNLTEHRHSIVKVLDALEARKSRPISTIGVSPQSGQAEYKGMPIGPGSQPNSTSGSASPAGARAARAPSANQANHNRSGSFAVRRPQARIVELLLDLCDTAIEINTPAVKEVSSMGPGEFRTQSPGSEDKLSQVMQWETPSSNTLEQEAGLSLLCADTEKAARNKVDAAIRHRRILEYSERIRMEFSMIVQDCIDEANRKAQRIAAGMDTDSTYDEEEEMQEMQEQPQDEGYLFPPPAETYTGTSNLAAALQKEKVKQETERNSNASRAVSETQGSDSPRECPTPKSHADTLSMHAETLSQLTEARRSSRASTRTSRRGSLYFESGAEDSDCGGSFRSSSIMSRMPRVDSPVSEFGGSLRRQASSRQRDRRSMVFPATGPGAISPQRQESPSRIGSSSGLGSNLNVNLTATPLRISKPRTSIANDVMKSPITSPLFSYNEFTSPSMLPHHHRRQSSANNSGYGSGPPPSPRLNSVSVPQARAVPPSIKDFEIIKPISKGAFGSVYLSKKKSTGDYFAIKVLKKADMVAKNQVTNVKAERAIMMWQGESDFVAKLYWTFSSKDYLYLVMEYLNGGDCASLIKVLGGLPEDWAKKYLGEVILGVEHLHSRGIVHRDLKPDNLLIDQKGHLKLTDFGLSRMGLIGRQKRVLKEAENDSAPDLLKNGPFARSSSIGSSRSTSFDFHNHHSPGSTPVMTPDLAGCMGQPSYFSLIRENSMATSVSSNRESNRRSMKSESGNSDAISAMLSNFTLNDATHQRKDGDVNMIAEDDRGSPEMYALSHVTSHGSVDHKSTPPNAMMPPPMALFDPDDSTRRFVGTPDYLAPETVRGVGQDETSDWWSVGCILFEFLYGYPPFHGETPEKVFENILARKISWPNDDEVEVSAKAKDLMNKMLCMDPKQRLGANAEEKYESGGAEIKAHPWFEDVNWATLLDDEAQFVPAPENLEDTEYFDTRGAILQTFAEEMEDQLSPVVTSTPAEYAERPHDALARVRTQVNNTGMKTRGLMPLHIPPHVRDLKSRRLSEPVVADDFGNFAFKNLPVLEKANKDVIQKLRADALAAQSKSACASPVSGPGSSVLSSQPVLEGSPAISMPLQRTISNAKSIGRPSSPAGYSQANSSPSRQSQPSSPLLLSFVAGQDPNRRKTSSNSSSLSQHQTLAPGGFFDVPRVSPGGLTKSNSVTAASSPLKGRAVVQPQPPLGVSPQKSMSFAPKTTTPGRTRSQTVGSQDGSNHGSPLAIGDVFSHHKRRSGVFDAGSPSSSDNEGDKANALLRVQRRRQSSRRLSHINLFDGPIFRPLDVLICEPTKSYQAMMVKLLEKLRCRTIVVADGAEATRVAMSDIKFDIIMMEFKLPSVNGTDVARMIRNTKNVNSDTPIIAVTSYVKDLQHPHFFDDLIEKPPSMSSLADMMGRFCNWKAPSPNENNGGVAGHLQYPMPSGLRQESVRLDDSPSTSGSSNYHLLHGTGSSFRGSSRGGSIGSSLFGDNESVMTDDIPTIVSRKATGDWGVDGLGITVDELLLGQDPKTAGAPCMPPTPHLIHQSTAPPVMSHARPQSPHRLRRKEAVSGLRDSRLESAESGDDEDELLGDVAVKEKSPKASGPHKHTRGSKLGTEMMRTNSRGSVVSGSDFTEEQPEFTSPLGMKHLSPTITRSTENISTGDSSGRLSPPRMEDISPGTVAATSADVAADKLMKKLEKAQLTPPKEKSEQEIDEDEFKTPTVKSKHFGSLGMPAASGIGSGQGSKSGTDSEEPTPRPGKFEDNGKGGLDYLSAGEPSLR